MTILKKTAAILILALTIVSCKSKDKAIDTTNSRTQTQQQTDRRTGQQGDRRGGGGAPSVDRVFQQDTNGDGLLSKAEVKGRMAERFDKIDTNGDGFISKQEFTDAPRPQRGQRPKRNQ